MSAIQQLLDAYEPAGGGSSVGDTFNRANNATTLGPASDGASYTVGALEVWGISGNKAYCPGANGSGPGGISHAYRSGGSATCTIGWVLDTGSGPGLIAVTFRIQDANNFFWMQYDKESVVRLYKVVAGSFVGPLDQVGGLYAPDSAGVVTTISTNSSTGLITSLVNGVAGPTTTDAAFKTQSRVGMSSDSPAVGATMRWDALTIT